jgi:hypothetical protein
MMSTDGPTTPLTPAPWPGDPSTGFTGLGASQDVLAAYADEPGQRKAPWLLVGGVALLVLALVGGVTYGVGQLSGGGSQPEDALPSGAFAFVKVDLDPSAGQKIDGFRFMRKFPALRDKLGDEDLRRVVFEAVADGAGWADVDFDSEVAPWMGKRIALAAYPPAGNGRNGSNGSAGSEGSFEALPGPAAPTAVVALQVTDEGAAETGLKRLISSTPGAAASPPGFVVAGDYALLAETQELAEQAARDADDGALAADDNLAADLAAAGDGVMAAWVDMDLASQAVSSLALGMGAINPFGSAGAGVAGRSTYVARFAGPDTFEVTGSVVGSDTAGWSTHAVDGLAELPASSVVALGLADGDVLVEKIFESFRTSLESGLSSELAPGQAPSFDEMLADAERELGIEVPEDVAALLGDNLVAALDGGDSQELQVGARLTTDVARAQRVLDALASAGGEDFTVARKRVGDDGLVVASTKAQAERLAATGTLGENSAFRAALPDLDDADLALWVDVKGVLAVVLGGLGGSTGEPDDNLEPIDGIGVTVSSRDEGSGSFRFRLVAH